MIGECTREPDVVASVLSGRWATGIDADLRSHADACTVCREGVAVAMALRADREHLNGASIPAAGQVWWRAAIRARAEAAHAAVRPMVWLQAVTGAAAVGAMAAGLPMVWSRVEQVFGRVLPFGGGSLPDMLPLLLAIGAGIVAAPIAFYFAVPRD